jgi:hypothetical protein
VKDFVYITDKAYSEKEVLQMELRILEVLEFEFGRPLPLHFLRRASKVIYLYKSVAGRKSCGVAHCLAGLVVVGPGFESRLGTLNLPPPPPQGQRRHVEII